MSDYAGITNEINHPLPTSTLYQAPSELRQLIACYLDDFYDVWIHQEQEIDYLTKHHFDLITKPEYAEKIQVNSKASLELFIAREEVLETINCDIVKKYIDINSTSLNVSKVSITRFPVRLFQEKDYVDFWRELTILNCSNNQITELNLNELKKLKELDCSQNLIKRLYIEQLAALQFLDCDQNQLTTLNLETLVKLKKLECDNNQLFLLKLEGPVALEQLSCDNNPLKILDLTGVPPRIKDRYAKLEKELLFRRLTVDIGDVDKWEVIERLGSEHTDANCLFYCSEIIDHPWVRQQKEIDYLTQYHPNRVTKYNKVLLQNSTPSLTSLRAREPIVEMINCEIVKAKIDINTTVLSLTKARITRLPTSLFQEKGYVRFWKNLAYLDCSKNLIAKLNLQPLVALKTLGCHNNEITSLDLQGMTNLKSLDCSQNHRLSILKIQGAKNLKNLHCDRCILTTLNLNGLKKLNFVDCRYNKISVLNLQGLKELNNLFCEKNYFLVDLNLTGVHADTKQKYAEKEKTLLYEQLNAAIFSKTRQQIIDRLGSNFNRTNCLIHCSESLVNHLFPQYELNQVCDSIESILISSPTPIVTFLHDSKKNEISDHNIESDMDLELVQDENARKFNI